MTLIETATPVQKQGPTILSIVSALYFCGVLLYGLIENSQANTCKDNYWVYLRVGGLIILFFFIILGVVLINRHKESYESNPEFTMIIKYSVAISGNGGSYKEELIEKNIENMLVKDEKNYNIWLIMGTHFFSAILSLTTTIYIAITDDVSTQECGFYPFDKELTNNITVLAILGWALYLINYFIPLIIILRVFLYREINLPTKHQPSFSEEDDFPYHSNLTVKGHDQALNVDKYPSPKSSSSSMNVDFENASKKSSEEQKEQKSMKEESEEEKKDWKEETRSSGFL